MYAGNEARTHRSTREYLLNLGMQIRRACMCAHANTTFFLHHRGSYIQSMDHLFLNSHLTDAASLWEHGPQCVPVHCRVEGLRLYEYTSGLNLHRERSRARIDKNVNDARAQKYHAFSSYVSALAWTPAHPFQFE